MNRKLKFESSGGIWRCDKDGDISHKIINEAKLYSINKEVALIACIISEEQDRDGSVITAFDTVHKKAVEFVEEHGVAFEGTNQLDLDEYLVQWLNPPKKYRVVFVNRPVNDVQIVDDEYLNNLLMPIMTMRSFNRIYDSINRGGTHYFTFVDKSMNCEISLNKQ